MILRSRLTIHTLFLLAGTLALSGSASAARHLTPPGWHPHDCQLVGVSGASTYLLCFRPNRGEHGTFFVRRGRGPFSRLRIGGPGRTASARDAGRVGHWAWAALSPDGRTFAAQWSGECEIATAFFVSTGEKPRPVTGEADWGRSPESTVYGWTRNGRAIVRLGKEACGRSGSPGIFLVKPGHARQFLGGKLIDPERSLTPQSTTSLVTRLRSGSHVLFRAGVLARGDRIVCVLQGLRLVAHVPAPGMTVSATRELNTGTRALIRLSVHTNGAVAASCS
jgi:hypothetical protein